MKQHAEASLIARLLEITKDLSDADLALALGLSLGGLRHLKNGKTSSLKLGPALRLCERLGVNPWYLAFGEGAVNQPHDGAGAGQGQLLSRLAAVEARLNRHSKVMEEMGTRIAAAVESGLMAPTSAPRKPTAVRRRRVRSEG
jgi:DNA-binding Xre family transcriptional regulator